MTKAKNVTIKEVERPLGIQKLENYIQGYLLKHASTLKMPIKSCRLRDHLIVGFLPSRKGAQGCVPSSMQTKFSNSHNQQSVITSN